MNPIDYMYRKLHAHANIVKKLRQFFWPCVTVVWMYFEFHIPPSPIIPVFWFLSVHQLFKDLLQAVNKSNLQSLFCNVVSTVDYSKESLNVGIMDSPCPSKYAAPHPPITIPSRMKGVAHPHDCG